MREFIKVLKKHLTKCYAISDPRYRKAQMSKINLICMDIDKLAGEELIK